MMKQPRHTSSTYGFSHAAKLMQPRIRAASEGRGFAQTRLLTHWAEIVGQDVAKTTQPVNITYGRGGMGATLTLLTTGSSAPIVEMQKEQIREKVNACYGYSAISRIRITQTAPTGFADGRATFGAAPAAPQGPDPQAVVAAQDLARDVTNPDLRAALEALGANILSKRRT
jgi:hypothetical protein